MAESELHMDHSGGRGADRRGSVLPLPQQKEEKEPAKESDRNAARGRGGVMLL